MEKILLIEDQDKRFNTIIDRFRRLLELTHSGFELLVYSNWKDALTFFGKEHERISLVVLDVRMPRNVGERGAETQFDKTTGIHVFEEMRKIKKDQVVLFWTVLSKDELMNGGVHVENDFYVEKSSDYLAFFGKVDNLIGTNLTESFDDLYWEL